MPVIETTTSETALPLPSLLAASALLAACGGGGGSPGDGAATSPSGSTTTTPTGGTTTTPASPAGGGTTTPAAPAAPAADPVTPVQASRFLAQASMGATTDHIARVQALGYSAWIDEQMAMTLTTTRWDWLISKGYNDIKYMPADLGADGAIWHKMLSGTDTLRQRVTFALSEILVTSIAGVNGGWQSFTAAAYLDMLEANAFGNYRNLLQLVSTSPAMGLFLTFRGNVKQNPVTGAMPDENYARECMQLFSIGLLQLNLDGTPKLVGGLPQETYTLDDITGLARVFTGWNWDLTGITTAVPDYQRRPMIMVAKDHESGTKTFLGTTIPAGTSGEESLRIALDTLFSHPSLAPNISRQLIQRLVTSNPSPAYVARVATVFNNDGSGVKGNLKAVIKAILLDTDARSDATLTSTTFGKQREPILRLTAWAHATGAVSTTDAWSVGNTSDTVSRLGQSPLRSNTVFNFFRPGYVPPNSTVATAGLVAPEFQITNESTVVGYVNYMQTVLPGGAGDVKSAYADWLPLADTSQALVDQMNLVLAAGQLPATTVALIKGAVDTMGLGTLVTRLNRIYAAMLLVLAAPEFIIQK